ncbi:MAG: PepSY domain-containing protein [Anaerovibrio sp.]|uniref:PepSY-associated TM helix domain-containing protein n=1 Tax=Anaerovibrio sp. TaxID=1872532 RepID=UPI0025F23CA1|nr:PepSY-associated TM helix domain-containing protein [Anaerovibrio sp.]MCR5177088.1 PepSY domain-containing protein [Anaerovibrio sp.]
MNKIYTLHKILGIISALVFIIVSITGFFLLFRGEIADRNNDNVEYVIKEDMDSAEIWSHTGEAIAALRDSYPSVQVESIRLYESSGRLSLRCHVDGRSKRMFYDVATQSLISPAGAVKQDFMDLTMQQFGRIHKNLGMGSIGRSILYVLCILIILTIVSGYYINRPISNKVPLGVIRKNSRRLWLSDWHRFISAMAGPWALIMTLSGVLIFCYSDMTKVYYAHAYEVVDAAPSYATLEQVNPGEIVSLLTEEYPSKKMVNMVIPEANNGFYEVQIADARENTNLYTPYELVFVQADNINNRIYIPDTGLRNNLAEALNIHLHNHFFLVTRLLWGIMALLSVLMAISGILLYLTRWYNRTYCDVAVRSFNNITSLRCPLSLKVRGNQSLTAGEHISQLVETLIGRFLFFQKKNLNNGVIKGYHVASASAVLSVIAMLSPLAGIDMEYIAVIAFIMIFLISAYAVKKLN